MGDALYVASSGAMARLRQLEAVANNLANADTVGFRRDRALFAALLGPELRRAGEAAADPARVFAAVDGMGFDRASGSIERTGAPLDAAIEGPGFFEVQTPAGPRYTRAGSFAVNADGEISTPDGLAVMGEGGPIAAGSRPVKIRASGEVVNDRGDVVGRLKVVTFPEDAPLQREGASRFAANGAEPQPLPEPRLVEQSLERSNVQPVSEMASLVLLQRSFDAAMRAVANDDESTRRLIQEIMR